ncbi:MAG: anti-sigma factor [Myxococcota bacterium]|nr:anti-sigma factor [Myxococcota bacterium]
MIRHAMIAAALLALAGCGGSAYQLQGQGPAIGTDAELEVASVAGDNRRIELDVRHLPPPNRLGASFETYHVWIAPAGGTPVLAGRLQYDAGDRRGRLTTITPHDRFRLMVTPEPRGSSYPTGQVVLEHYHGG